MNRYWFVAMAGLVLAGCAEKEEKLPAVDLRGRLVVDSAITEQRQAQGIQGEYYQRILTLNGTDMTFNEFLSKYAPIRTRETKRARRHSGSRRSTTSAGPRSFCRPGCSDSWVAT